MTSQLMVIGLNVLTVLAMCGVAAGQTSQQSEAASPKVYTIMPVGDSTTEGNGGVSYRYPLWEKLQAAGYFVEFVGSRQAETRIGPLLHEGWGGHRAEFFAENMERLYKANPADIVLLHSGHNHFVEEKPVAGIVAATESIIATIQRINPQATILVAQVIPAGKLPKYSYIPELNSQLADLVKRLDPDQTKVILVNQADGFDIETDTVPDKVHPNPKGAEKMAQKWFETLVKVLPSPGEQLKPELMTYKKGKGYELKLHVFRPPSARPGEKRAAIVYFFGGGWSRGTPLQFYAESRQLASRGMVAICADYRIEWLNHTTPFECVADGKSAIRWVRQHADELAVDPDRIAAAGASAGGHLAAATAITHGFDEPGENLSISSRPDALVLFYPVIDNGPGSFGNGEIKDRYKEFSPLHAIDRQAPPTVIFQGKLDTATPVATMQAFQKRLQEFGGRCDLHLYDGCRHGIYSYREPPTKECLEIRQEVETFLQSLGYLTSTEQQK